MTHSVIRKPSLTGIPQGKTMQIPAHRMQGNIPHTLPVQYITIAYVET
jgi:hypothetical protein